MRHLLARGLLAPGDVFRPGFSIADLSGRHRVLRVGAPDRTGWLVKQAWSPAGRAALAHEAAFLRLFATAAAPLAAGAPVLEEHDPDRGILVVRAVPDATPFTGIREPRRRVEAAARLGAFLAGLHAWDVAAVRSGLARDAGPRLTGAPPWILLVDRPTPADLRTLSGGGQELIRAVQRSGRLRGALADTRRRWRAEAVVHHDLRPENCLARRLPRTGRSGVLVVDWELADVGDPAWDVGSALAGWIAAALRAETRTGTTSRTTGDAARAFWAGYLGTSRDGAADLAERALRFAGARLIQAAFESVQLRTRMTARAGDLLRLGGLLLVEPDGVVAWRFRPPGRVPHVQPAMRPRRGGGAVGADERLPRPVGAVALREGGRRRAELAPTERGARRPFASSPRAGRERPGVASRDAGLPGRRHVGATDSTASGGLRAIAAAAAAVTFPSSDGFAWLGIEEGPPVSGPRSAGPRRGLRAAIARRLYASFHLHGEPVAARRPDRHPADPPPGVTAAFEAVLSSANRGRGSVEPGWRLHSIRGGEARVHRNGFEVVAPLQSVVGGGPAIALRLPKELLGASPGFYVALGDRGLDPDQPVLRVYWNLRSSGAAPLVDAATGLLNAAGLGFRLKVRNDPSGFDRCDAAVLYVPLADAVRAAPLVRRIRARIAAHLGPSTPPLALRVAPGVAIAEEPPGRLSFGQHRCLLLAEGLLRAREAGARSLSERVDAVVRCFAVHGLRVGALHLNPGSAGIEWTHGPERAAIAASGSPLGTAVTRGAPRPSPSGPLDLAVRLGRRVAARAVHHAGRCTWIAPIARHGSAARRRAEALPADLYAGAAGVALFLAELHAVTHDRAAKTVALGAMHHALDAVREPGSRSRGLFAGPLGVALAGARTGWLLEEPALIERAAAAARRHRRPPADSRGLDLMGGAAGDVVALLALSAMLGDRTLAEAAVEVGDALASRASSALRRDRRGLGSPLHTRASPAPPVGANGGGPAPGGGFAHGAAGVGCALLELFAWTRNARHAAVAARIFDAGRRWLEVPPRDGASLRRNATTRPPTDPQVAAGWCRGTAGVGLSRLRVRELDGSRAAGAEAVIALRRTVAALRANVGVGRGDFSLCHGLTGLAAALLEGVRVLGVSRPAVRAVNGLVDAALALERRGEPWPCAAEAEHPGLMNGLAGIGWFHLRLGRPGIPSMLLVRPEVWGPGRAAGLGPPSAGRAVPSAAGQARIGERQGSPVLHPAGRRPARSTLTPAPPA